MGRIIRAALLEGEHESTILVLARPVEQTKMAVHDDTHERILGDVYWYG
jgi:hypothetical protein